MDIKEFGKTYNLSRGQVERLIAKAKNNKNRFELPGFGNFIIKRTGKAKTAKIDILADVRHEETTPPHIETEKESTPPPRPSKMRFRARWSELSELDTAELIKLRHIAQIEKLRESTEAGRRETRRQFMNEALETITRCFTPLRKTLEELKLDSEQLEKLRNALNETLEAVKQEQENNQDEE